MNPVRRMQLKTMARSSSRGLWSFFYMRVGDTLQTKSDIFLVGCSGDGMFNCNRYCVIIAACYY